MSGLQERTKAVESMILKLDLIDTLVE